MTARSRRRRRRRPPARRRRPRGTRLPRRSCSAPSPLAVIVAVALTPNFLTVDNVRAILRNASIVGIVAVAMTPITLSGNFVSLGTRSRRWPAMIVVRRPARERAGRRRWRSSSSSRRSSLVGILQGRRRRGRAQSGHHDARGRRDHLRRRRRATGGGIVRVGEHPVSWGDAHHRRGPDRGARLRRSSPSPSASS